MREDVEESRLSEVVLQDEASPEGAASVVDQLPAVNLPNKV